MSKKRGPGPPWFGPKVDGIPGISFMPIAWQGWAAMFVFIAIAAGTVVLPISGVWHAIAFAACIVIFGVIGRLCYDGAKEPS